MRGEQEEKVRATNNVKREREREGSNATIEEHLGKINFGCREMFPYKENYLSA